MYSRQHLLSMFGCTKAQLEFAATKGWMSGATRAYPGGPRLLSASQVLELAEKMKVKLDPDIISRLNSESATTDHNNKDISKGEQQ